MTFIIGGVLVIILTFFIFLTFFSGISKSVVSESDDMICRALVASQDKTKVLGVFLFELNNKCKVDYDSTLSLEDKDEGFKEIAHYMSRCWYRFGE